ncbi:unnamed protein product, partial [Nesidiocoris tenuis]
MAKLISKNSEEFAYLFGESIVNLLLPQVRSLRNANNDPRFFLNWSNGQRDLQ